MKVNKRVMEMAQFQLETIFYESYCNLVVTVEVREVVFSTDVKGLVEEFTTVEERLC